MSTSSPSTPDRILEAALKLFNEHGYSNVPSLRIAMHMGISPGHLAYHFKSKTEMVVAVFPQLENEVRKDLMEASKPGLPFTPKDAAVHQIELFRILWKYRFVFNALTQLLQDEELHRRFMTLQENIIATTQGLFDDLIAHGYMRPVSPPNSTRIIARSQWMIWLSWLRFEQIEHPERETARNAAVFEGVLQGFSTIQPYFDTEFANVMLDIVRAELPEDKAPASSRAADRPGQKRSGGAGRKAASRGSRGGGGEVRDSRKIVLPE